MKSVLSSLCCTALVLTSALSLHAQTTSVDWGGNYVSSNQQFGEGSFGTYRFNDSNSDDATVPNGSTRQRVLFGLTNSTAGYFRPNSGYTAPAGKTSNFFIGHNTVFSGGPADPNVFRITDHADTGADGIRLLTQGVFNGSTNSVALLGFAKADFLNGTSDQTRALDATTSISIALGSDAIQLGTARYAVLDAGQWYLSNTTFSIDGGTHTLSSSGTEQWGAFNPLGTGGGSSLVGTGLGVAPSSFSAISLNDVQGFGLWVTNSGNAIDFEVTGFTATTVAAIPEPSSLALVGLGLGVVGFIRRKRA